MTTPKVVDCVEYEHITIDPELLLGSDHGLLIDSDVDGMDAFTVDFKGGKVRLRASSLVGVIPLNENVILRVRPRFPISNLTRMVVETGHPTVALKAFRPYEATGQADDWILDLYSEAILDMTDELLTRGMYRTYQRHDGDGSFPRGRIDFHATMNRFAARGVDHKAAFHWFERTPDNPANRCLKAALMRVHAHLNRGVTGHNYRLMGRRVAGHLGSFADVQDDATQSFLTDPEVTGLRPLPEPRDYYRPVLDLAVTILAGKGLRLEAGAEDFTMPSVCIEMNKLFENYTRMALQRQQRERGWAVEVVDGNKEHARFLYSAPDPLPTVVAAGAGMQQIPRARGKEGKATPDIVFVMPDGTVPLVAEVKNTAKGGDRPERSETNQAVTYAVTYGLDRVLVIRPFKDHGQPGLGYCGRVGGIDVFDYKVDLGNDDLDTVMAGFADAVARLLPDEATVAQVADVG